MNNTQTLIITFNNQINTNEITKFRGAILAALGEERNILFHNHIGDGFRYSYPLIQYKRIQNKAALLCIKEGVEKIGEFFAKTPFILNIGGKLYEFEIANVKPENTLIQIWDDLFSYRINRWLPLSSENYTRYIQMESLAERIQFLEKILIGNILSFAKGIDIHIENQLSCTITFLSEPTLVCNKNTKLMAFNIEFKTNISLPSYIGLGKNASIGYGIVSKITRK